MQVFCALFLLFFGVKAFEEDNVIRIPLQRNFVSKEKLMERQNARLSKLGIKKGSLPKYHQKLLESTFRNDYFTMNLSLGTPKQDFQVIIRSGAVRLWVLDKEYANRSKNQNVYSPTSSSTSKDLSKDFSQTDGSFHVFGKYYSDFLQIGPIKVDNQAFGSVQKIEDEDSNMLYPVDGAIGLNHLIDSVYKNGSELAAPIDNILKYVKKSVTIYLGPYVTPQNSSSQSGQISFGGFDEEHCSRDRDSYRNFSLISAEDDNRYVVNMTDFYYYNTHGSDDKLSDSSTAYFDSGISTIVMPPDVLVKFLTYITADYDWDLGIYTYPCKISSELGYFYFHDKNSNWLYIYPKDYLVDINLKNGQCALALEMNDGRYKEDYIFGAPFLRSYCSSYDFDNSQIQFYALK